MAVFDADFVPPRDFLRKTVNHFTDDGVGMVQVRWEHLNRGFSSLTEVQSILLDAHFVIEHTARNRSGRFFNFNGTAGIWRRATIASAGGWQHDTLTEDLDLSYRAQMKGWKFVFLPEVVAPAEIPVEMSAFKSQQHRWAKGSIQTAMKLLPRILSSELPYAVKKEAFFHLTANVAYLLMIPLAILMPITVVVRVSHGWIEVLLLDLPFFATATMSVCVFYVASQREIHASTWQRIKYLPYLMALGIGLSVNQARAVVEALLGHQTVFTRTPKSGVQEGVRGRSPEALPRGAEPAAGTRAGAGGLLHAGRGLGHRPGRLVLPALPGALPGRLRLRRAHERRRGAARLLVAPRPGAAAGRRRGVKRAAAARAVPREASRAGCRRPAAAPPARSRSVPRTRARPGSPR